MSKNTDSLAVVQAEKLLLCISKLSEGIDNATPYNIKWMSGKNPVEVKAELDYQGIPYYEAKNNPNLIFIDSDEDTVKTVNAINIKALEEKALCHYIQEIPKNQLERAIAEHPGIKNKNIIEFTNLSEDQADVFIKKCNHISSQMLVGTERNGKNTTVCFAEGLLTNKDTEEIAKAFLDTSISVNGCSSKIQNTPGIIDYQRYIAEKILSEEIDFVINERVFDVTSTADVNDYLSQYRLQAIYALSHLDASQYNDLHQSKAIERAVNKLQFNKIDKNIYQYSSGTIQKIRISSHEALKEPEHTFHADQNTQTVSKNERGEY